MLFCHIFSLCLFNTYIDNSLVFYMFYFFTLFVCLFSISHEPWQRQHLLFCQLPLCCSLAFLWVACLAFFLRVACLAACENLFTGRKRGPAKLPSETCVLPTKLNSWLLFFHLQLYVPAPLSLSSVFPLALLVKVGN